MSTGLCPVKTEQDLTWQWIISAKTQHKMWSEIKDIKHFFGWSEAHLRLGIHSCCFEDVCMNTQSDKSFRVCRITCTCQMSIKHCNKKLYSMWHKTCLVKTWQMCTFDVVKVVTGCMTWERPIRGDTEDDPDSKRQVCQYWRADLWYWWPQIRGWML